MNPQKRINELFLDDVLTKIKEGDCDAVECFSRLRLYITVTGYNNTSRALLLERGLTSKEYDSLLRSYNRQLARRVEQT